MTIYIVDCNLQRRQRLFEILECLYKFREASRGQRRTMSSRYERVVEANASTADQEAMVDLIWSREQSPSSHADKHLTRWQDYHFRTLLAHRRTIQLHISAWRKSLGKRNWLGQVDIFFNAVECVANNRCYRCYVWTYVYERCSWRKVAASGKHKNAIQRSSAEALLTVKLYVL